MRVQWFSPLQFGLRSMLLAAVLLALCAAWLAQRIERARREEAALKTVAACGGYYFFDYELAPDGAQVLAATPPGPAWVRALLGEHFFATVVEVGSHTGEGINEDIDLAVLQTCSLAGPEVDDDKLTLLTHCSHLRSLNLCGSYRVTSTGMSCLRGLVDLQELDVSNTGITDAGLEQLHDLSNLERLNLENCRVSSEGLKKVAELAALVELNLSETHVSDDGLGALAQLGKLQSLRLIDCPITDAGLTQLTGLPVLRWLDLRGTRCSSKGVNALRGTLPNCDIQF
jgi:Leucine-rich repeat (LRR) protein